MKDLFGERPRRPARVLMHVFDAGHLPGGQKGIVFRCSRCGHDTGWIRDTQSVSDNKRGMPCPQCNPKE